MANNFWQDVLGGAQNLLASGKVYDSRTNTYAPQGVRVPRTVAGVIGQVNPIAGLIGGQLANNLPAGSLAWEKRLDAPEGVVRQFDQQATDRSGFLQDAARAQLAGNPQVSVGTPQYMPQGFGSSPGMGMPNTNGLFDGYADAATQRNLNNSGSRMDAAMQGIQDQINGQGVPTMGAVNSQGSPGFMGSYNAMTGNGLGFGSIGGGSTSLSNYGDMQMMASVGSGGKNQPWGMDSWLAAMQKK